MLGQLEETILFAALKVRGEAMPSAIYEAIVDAMSPRPAPAFGAVFTALNRMEAKGFVRVSMTRDSKGRDRRAFTVTGAGHSALCDVQDTHKRLGAADLAGALA